MEIKIYRGGNEIGGSQIAVCSKGGTRVLLDAGTELQGEKAGLIPDIGKFSAVLISHAHPDHFGLVNEIPGNVPIYCGAITEDFLRILTAFNGKKLEKVKRPFQHFKSGKTFAVGDIRITPVAVDHSVADAYAFLLESDGERVFYTGDFRESGRKPYLMRGVREAASNADCLIVEGTCLGGERGGERKIYETELEVEREITRILKEEKLPAFALTSPLNVDRVVSLYKAALQTGRIFVCNLYTAFNLWCLSERHGRKTPKITWEGVRVLARDDFAKSQRNILHGEMEYLNSSAFLRRVYRKDISILPEEMDKSPGRYLILHSRVRDLMGAMGVEMAAVIYSMWSGYLSDRFDTGGRLRALASDKNIHFHKIHTSGHMSQTALFEFIDAVQPKCLLPVHTNARDAFIRRYPGIVADRYSR